jgi:predicted DNA binding CopG/RHH family protein
MNNFIDNEEKELIESLHSEEWVSDFNADIKKEYEEYARQSLSNTKQISISVSERDYNKIQTRAIQEGLSYQSLIALLIHKFNEDKIAITL